MYFLHWLCITLLFLVFFANFFLSQIPWFSVYFLQGLSPNHIIPCTKSMVQIPAGFFSYGRATRLFFLFHVLPVQVHGWSSYFCKLRPASISLWIPTLGADISTDISTDISADISADISTDIRTQSYMQTRVKTCIHRIVPSWGVRLERDLSCGAQFRFGCDGN